MSKKRQRTPKRNVLQTPKKTYAEALEAVRHAQALSLHTTTSVIHPPHPKLPIDNITQVKLATITKTMMSIGRLPGDFPVTEFDRPVRYRKLEPASFDWLEKYGVRPRQDYAPLAADYILLFGDENRLPVTEKEKDRFLSRLIHCLLIETQIIIARQYYHGLGFYDSNPSPAKLSRKSFPKELLSDWQLASLNATDFQQLRGRVFLEYCAVMIRAQWDKLTRLSCMTFGLKTNWNSISDGLKKLEEFVGDEDKLHPWCNFHLRLFIDIANERVSSNSWLKRFRDPLLHDVGQHSSGVAPHRKSIETTSEMWDKVCDEHDWLREAMMALLASFISAKEPLSK